MGNGRSKSEWDEKEGNGRDRRSVPWTKIFVTSLALCFLQGDTHYLITTKIQTKKQTRPMSKNAPFAKKKLIQKYKI